MAVKLFQRHKGGLMLLHPPSPAPFPSSFEFRDKRNYVAALWAPCSLRVREFLGENQMRDDSLEAKCVYGKKAPLKRLKSKYL